MLEPHFHLRRLCVARRVSLASRDARRTLLVSPACFCFLLRLQLGTRGRPAWHDSRHRQSQSPPPRPPASGLARMNPRSRQSSIHHLAAELATCQPAALCESRTRHVAIPSAPCETAPTAPDRGFVRISQYTPCFLCSRACQRPRNQLSPVVTAFALPIRVQRDRHQVRAERLASRATISAKRAANRSPSRVTSSYFSSRIAWCSASLYTPQLRARSNAS